jgi:hypothetical protein
MKATRILSAPVRAIVWTLDICDPKGAPSLAKGLALGFGVAAARDAWMRGFTAMNVAAMALVLSAAFGRSVFMNWLARSNFSSMATTNVSASVALTGDAAKVVEAIRNRRDETAGIDPA